MWRARAVSATVGPLLATALVGSTVTLAVFGTRIDLPVVGADELPYRLEGERLREAIATADKPVGQLGDGGYRIYQNTSFGLRLELSRAQTVPIGLVARGHASGGGDPYVVLRIDGELASEFHVTSSHWSRYEERIELDEGLHDLEWAYINDRAAFPEPRNLDLRAIDLGRLPAQAAERPRWTVPCEIEPERLAYRSYAQIEGDAFHLWNHGYVADDVFVERSGRTLLRMVLARPAGATSVGRLQIDVDGVRVDELAVGAGPSVVSLWLDLERGNHRLAWRYVSEARSADTGEDLQVERFLLGTPAPRRRSGAALDLSGDRVVLAGSALQVRSTGQPTGDAWTLWSNGFLRQTLTAVDDASWKLTIRARGDLCEGQGPRLLVIHDTDQLALLNIDELRFHDYFVPIHGMSRGLHELTLVYDNDRSIPGQCDRNVHIESIILDRKEPRAQRRRG